MKYTKTKYPNIFSYDTEKGKRYMVRRGYFLNGKKKEASKSGLKTIAEARHWLSQIEEKIRNNEFAHDKNLTVDQYFQRYYEKRLEVDYWSPNTAANVLNIFNNHFKGQYGSRKLKDLSRSEYELYINSLLKTHSRHTVRQMHGVFMAILNDAVVCQNLDFNPLSKIFIGESAVPPKNKRISVKEFQVWMQRAEDMLRKYDFAFLYLTIFGLRKSEIVGLHLDDVTFDSGRATLYIHDSRSDHTKNGRGKTKTGKSRYVVLDEKGSDLMIYAVKESRRIAAHHGFILSGQDFLYRDEKDGAPVSVHRTYHFFEKISNDIGVRVSPHMMRHFFATQNIIAGTPIEHLSAVLGHSRAYMTEKYTHIQNEVSQSVTDNFSRLVGDQR